MNQRKIETLSANIIEEKMRGKEGRMEERGGGEE